MPGYELEPNERKVDATPVALGQAIAGTIGHGNDDDWYRYELPVDESAAAGAAASEELDAGVRSTRAAPMRASRWPRSASRCAST